MLPIPNRTMTPLPGVWPGPAPLRPRPLLRDGVGWHTGWLLDLDRFPWED